MWRKFFGEVFPDLHTNCFYRGWGWRVVCFHTYCKCATTPIGESHEGAFGRLSVGASRMGHFTPLHNALHQIGACLLIYAVRKIGPLAQHFQVIAVHYSSIHVQTINPLIGGRQHSFKKTRRGTTDDTRSLTNSSATKTHQLKRRKSFKPTNSNSHWSA